MQNANEFYEASRNALLQFRNQNNLNEPINTFVNTLDKLNEKRQFDNEFKEIYAKVADTVQFLIDETKPGVGRLYEKNAPDDVRNAKNEFKSKINSIRSYIAFAAFGKDVKGALLTAIERVLTGLSFIFFPATCFDNPFSYIQKSSEKAFEEAKVLKNITENVNSFFKSAITSDKFDVYKDLNQFVTN